MAFLNLLANHNLLYMDSKNVSQRNITTRSNRHRVSYSCTVNPVDNGIRPEFPTYIAMANMCVTPSGFSDPKVKEDACSKIHLMSGEISMAYTSRTTHLLAAHANTTKVELARQRDLPVVTTEWVEYIWNACQQNYNPYIHASHPDFKNFEYPLFHNLHFVFSKRYDLECKQFYESLLTLNGGIVATSLKKALNYFYICQEPENERKYQYAQAKEIACLPLAWIIECVNRKTVSKVAEFEIKGTNLVDSRASFQMDVRERNFRRSLNLIDLDHSLPNYSSNVSDFNQGWFLKDMDGDITMADVSSSTIIADSSGEISMNDSFADKTPGKEDGNRNSQASAFLTVAA